LTNLSTQTISDIEGLRTWVSERTLIKLAKALKIDIFQLLLPDPETEKAEKSLPQRIQVLRKHIKEDIDRQFDKFFVVSKKAPAAENTIKKRRPR
jgi:transcriptional regulator with XRE-family HTH domain